MKRKYQVGGLLSSSKKEKEKKKSGKKCRSTTNLLEVQFFFFFFAPPLLRAKRPSTALSARALSSLRGASPRFRLQPLGLRDGAAPAWCVRGREIKSEREREGSLEKEQSIAERRRTSSKKKRAPSPPLPPLSTSTTPRQKQRLFKKKTQATRPPAQPPTTREATTPNTPRALPQTTSRRRATEASSRGCLGCPRRAMARSTRCSPRRHTGPRPPGRWPLPPGSSSSRRAAGA